MSYGTEASVAERARAGLFESSFWRSRAVLDELRREGVSVTVLAPILTEAATHPEPRVRRRAVVWLARGAGDAEPIASLLAAFLNDPAWEVRRAAAQALALRASEAIDSERLFVALRDPDAAVREAAAEALGQLPTGSPTAAEALTAALSDRDDAVRVAVLTALRAHGPAAATATPALLACLRDDRSDVRRLALIALTATSAGGAAVEEALIAALSDDDPAVCRAALDALGALGETKAATVILPFLDAGPALRSTAVRAMIQLGRRHPEVEGVLLPLLSDRSPPRRQAAARLLAELDSSEAWELLRADLKHERPSWRRRALLALAWFARRSAELLPDLERGLHDSHARVRAAAVVALGRLGPSGAPLIGGLIRRCHDQDQRVRAAADAALARLLPLLPEPSRSWLERMTEPTRSAAENLRSALENPDLPDRVRTEFAAMCRRRIVWHARRLRSDATETAELSLWDLARKTAEVAVDRQAEHVWQMAQLWNLLRL